MPYPGLFSLFNFAPDAVLICAPREFLCVILSCQLKFSIYLRHLFKNVCSFLVIVFVTRRVSEP